MKPVSDFGVQSYKKNCKQDVIKSENLSPIYMFFSDLDAFLIENCFFLVSFWCRMFVISNKLCTFATNKREKND